MTKTMHWARVVRKYPKSKGVVNNHRGQNLFYRVLKAVESESSKHYADEDKVKRLLRLLPLVFDRCRRNEGY